MSKKGRIIFPTAYSKLPLHRRPPKSTTPGQCLNSGAHIIFFATLALISATLLAGNVLLATLLRMIHSVRGSGPVAQPYPLSSISIIVPAYNEEKNIGQKIDTLRRALQAIDVDAEVIIGSDGSTDGTVNVIRSHLKEFDSASWRVLEFENEGKCSTLNKLVAAARGDVIISTDADIPVPENSIALVVAAFKSDAQLGCLSCIPWFDGLNIGSQKAYWSIEDQIRRSESKLGRLIVVTGMLYAYKKKLFEEIPAGVMADDLWVPLNVLIKGYESVQVEELRVPYEKTDEETEILRRKRVIVGGMDVFRRLWPELIKTPTVLLLVLLHKVNRWAFPAWLFLFLGSVGILVPWVFVVYVLGTALVYLRLGGKRFHQLAYAVISPILSLAEVLHKSDFARWEHTRKH